MQRFRVFIVFLLILVAVFYVSISATSSEEAKASEVKNSHITVENEEQKHELESEHGKEETEESGHLKEGEKGAGHGESEGEAGRGEEEESAWRFTGWQTLFSILAIGYFVTVSLNFLPKIAAKELEEHH